MELLGIKREEVYKKLEEVEEELKKVIEKEGINSIKAKKLATIEDILIRMARYFNGIYLDVNTMKYPRWKNEKEGNYNP